MPTAAPPLAVRPSGPLHGEAAAPASKSVSHRALILAALAEGRSRLRGVLDAADIALTRRALAGLGLRLTEEQPGTIAVAGCGGRIPAAAAELDLGNAGTALRFLTAVAALGKGRYRLDGDARMRQRPIGDLADGLGSLGIRVEALGAPGCPPILVSGGPLGGGRVEVRADRSSQFASALLLVAPCTARGVDLQLAGRAVSRPYIDLTLDLMARFGGPEVAADGACLRVPGGGGYRGSDLTIEGDFSAAAYLFAAAAITGGSLRITNLPAASRQADAAFVGLLERMGCRAVREAEAVRIEAGAVLRGIRADLADCPDLAPALAAVALFAEGSTTIEGAAHLRLKESDRIADLAAGLRRLGATVDERPDGLKVHPGPLHGARLDPRSDHRLAMAFTAAGLRIPGVLVEEPGCVAKSFPRFFQAIDSLRT